VKSQRDVPLQVLIEGVRSLGIALSPDQVDQFQHYASELIDWNRRVNLTAITERTEIVRKHFLDSLTVLAVIDLPVKSRLIDVGSGAGFPGLPLRIARPDLRLTLLEATRKKCDFLNHVLSRLALEGVRIVHARAEEAGRDPAHREQYDVAIARSVAGMNVLAEYLLPLVRVGGWVVAQKSGDVQTEVERALSAIATLGGRVRGVAPVSVPGVDEPRAFVRVEKIAPVPEKYPRRAGMPEKRPLR